MDLFAQIALVSALALPGSDPRQSGGLVDLMEARALGEADQTQSDDEFVLGEQPEWLERAYAALEAEDWAEAERASDEALSQAPGDLEARRYKAWALSKQGQRQEAIEIAKGVLDETGSVQDRGVLIMILVGPDVGFLRGAENRLATSLVEAQIEEPGLSGDDALLLCGAASTLEDVELLSAAQACARRVAPEDPTTHYFAWVLKMTEGDLDAALGALEKARECGMPEGEYQSLKQQTEAEVPAYERWLPLAGWVGGTWLAIAIFLFLSGSVLSYLALRAARRVPNARGGEAVGAEAFLRSAYRFVLMASGLYYYLSVPLVLIATALAGAGVIYGFFVLGRIPIQLVLVILVAVAVTLISGVRSVFIWGRSDAEPGERLDLERHPRLREVLSEVAAKIGTRPVDNVYLTPGTDLAVCERGGVLRRMGNHTERCLILGVGVLEGMKLSSFKAILGHEYGHFVNRDTAGGGLALSVRRSIGTMAQGLIHSDAASWFNPTWLFLWGFNSLFLRISFGASRLQEVLADRWAAYAYGAQSFEDGLRHVIRRGLQFDADTQTLLSELVAQGTPLENIYTHEPSHPVPRERLEEAYEAAVNAEPTQFDSHPSPRDRFEWVHALGEQGVGELPDADRDVWALFDDRIGIEQQMTECVRESVRQQHGVEIPVLASV